MKATAVIGLGFGDEGKGATVDYICRTEQVELVTRFSGGPQCGHNVVLPDGRHHTFSQFGSGTLAGVPTYLDSDVIIDPLAMYAEADHLEELGVSNPMSMITAHPSCLVITPLHRLANRCDPAAINHGTCGVGVGKAKEYWLKYGEDAIFAEDLTNIPKLSRKLKLLQYRLYEEQPEMDLFDFHRYMVKEIRLSEQMPARHHVVFEGNQGVLLDEYWGFQPHTTWTSTLIPDFRGVFDHIEVLGITRTYHTRHGNGPFPTAGTLARHDPHNPFHEYQGTMRFGYLDLRLLRYALRLQPVTGLVVNHCDEVQDEWWYADGDDIQMDYPPTFKGQVELGRKLIESKFTGKSGDPIDIIGALAPIRILGHGPSYIDRELRCT